MISLYIFQIFSILVVILKISWSFKNLVQSPKLFFLMWTWFISSEKSSGTDNAFYKFLICKFHISEINWCFHIISKALWCEIYRFPPFIPKSVWSVFMSICHCIVFCSPDVQCVHKIPHLCRYVLFHNYEVLHNTCCSICNQFQICLKS